jgi:hypothetical protein
MKTGSEDVTFGTEIQHKYKYTCDEKYHLKSTIANTAMMRYSEAISNTFNIVLVQ